MTGVNTGLNPKKSQLRAKNFTREIRFLALFLGGYFVFHYIYFLVPDQILLDVVYHNGIVVVSETFIDLAAPQERVAAVQNKLLSTKAALEVVRGCDGSGALFLILAAIIAFPSKMKSKFTGLLLAVALIYALNQIRIVGLYFVAAYQREWFLPIHTYFAPTLIVIVGCVYFAWWALWSRGPAGEPTVNR